MAFTSAAEGNPEVHYALEETPGDADRQNVGLRCPQGSQGLGRVG